MELRKTFQFEAAHLLPLLPETHKCRRLHGHSFQAEIVVEGPLDGKLGWVMDYAEIGDAFRPLWEQLGYEAKSNAGHSKYQWRRRGIWVEWRRERRMRK